MALKKISLIVLPDSKTTPRHLAVPQFILWGIPALLIALVAAGFLLFYSTSSNVIDKAHLAQLEAENQALAERIEQLNARLDNHRSLLDGLVEKDKAIRTIFGMPEIDPQIRQLGIGGIPQREEWQLFEGNGASLSELESQLADLERRISFENQSLEEILLTLSDKKEELDHTPSIIPAEGYFSSGFGRRIDPFSGRPQMHKGLDIAGPKGTPVIATAKGRVSYVGWLGRFGKTIKIDHGSGYRTVYAHLSRTAVRKGRDVERGDIIGYSGSTGRSTGPHLHYEVWRNGRAVNPAPFMYCGKWDTLS